MLGFAVLHLTYIQETKDMQDEIGAVQTLANTIIDFFVNYSFQVVGAVLVLVVGVIVARLVASFLRKNQYSVSAERYPYCFSSAVMKGRR